MISVIVPVYNTEKYLRECIDSILAQTYSNFELLLIDDGSTDKSGGICDEYASHPSIRVFHKENGGVSSARNVGLDNAKGEWVCFVDSDDWLECDALERLINKQQETDADVVSGSAIAHHNEYCEVLKNSEYRHKDELMLHMIELTFEHVLWRRLIRLSLYKDNNIRCVEGVNIGEDHHTLPKLIYYANKCVELDRVIYHYNCLNERSYTRGEKNGLVIAESDLASTNILINFFKDKDERCYFRLNEIKAGLLFNLMQIYYSMSQRKKYNAMTEQLYQMPKNCIEAAGLSYAWSKLVYRTYDGLTLYKKLFAWRKS